jgi:hypothetical protein
MNHRNKIEKLASAWIRRYENKSETDTQWAYDKLDDLCRKSPIEALAVIFKIFEKTNCEEVLDNLAAGPLEDVLANFGNEVINDISEYTAHYPKFCDVLSGIWSGRISDEVLDQIESILSSHGDM